MKDYVRLKVTDYARIKLLPLIFYGMIHGVRKVSKTEYDAHEESHGYIRFIDTEVNLGESTNETLGEDTNEIPTNEKTEEDNKINLGDNIDETKLVLGDTPFFDKYIPIEWLEHLVKTSPLVESHKENANQLLASQYRQVLTEWRISGAASYPIWKSSVQNTDIPF